MADSIEVPDDVMSALLAGFAAGTAARNLETLGIRKIRLLHPGDTFGRVFAWVWGHDHAMAMVLLADYLAEMRDRGHRAADVDPPVSLDEVLRGLRLALPRRVHRARPGRGGSTGTGALSFYGDEAV